MSINGVLNEIGKVEEMARESAEIMTAERIQIEYRLIKVECFEKFYFVSVSDGSETEVVSAGSDENGAKKLFCAFVSGTVTPCSAADVARDINRPDYNEK